MGVETFGYKCLQTFGLKSSYSVFHRYSYSYRIMLLQVALFITHCKYLIVVVVVFVVK